MKRLKVPLWVDIIYLVLTIGVPIALILVEVYETDNTGYHITFSIFCAILLAYILCKKYLLSKYLDKLRAQTATLELNYNTGVGDKYLTKRMWAVNKIIDYAISTVQVILIGVVFYLIIYGSLSTTIRLNLFGVLLFIAITYLVAIVFRLVTYFVLFMRNKQNNEE